MRKAHLLTTVAASLLFAAGTAAAQVKDQVKDQAPERAPAAQQSAPAEKIAPSMQAGERNKSETTGQAIKSDDSGKADLKSDEQKKPDLKADDSKKPATVGQTKPSEPAKSELKSDSKADAANSKASTSGQGAAAGTTKLSTEQRSKITSVIRQQKVQPTTLNISVRVGAAIPASVRFHPLPTEVVEVYPEWRGYEFILVGNEILVVNPRTHQIVAILEA